MAEGVAYETSNLDKKYFCHQCLMEVSPINALELLCPECQAGFLEEIVDVIKTPDEFDPLIDYLDISPYLSSNPAIGRVIDESIEEDDTYPEVESEADTEDFPELDRLNFPVIRQPQELRRFFEAPLSWNIESSADEYNFDDDDVDTIASQLLDQVEISGPPPLSKEQIKALPLVTLTKDQESSEMQCTVCMSDFKSGDKAKKLTCEHLFHEKCIVPWLEKQASCPNCRSTIKVEGKSKRSLSYPRTHYFRSRNSSSSDRRFSEVPALSDFFTASSINPFRLI